MRFIVMHKVDANMEAGAKPDAEIIKGMGGLVGESIRSGVFLDGAGLHRSARRVRLRCKGGTCTTEKGPYAGQNELIASMAMIHTASMDEAEKQAKRFAAALGDVEIEIGPVVEAWDLTGSPKPKDVVGEKFLLLIKGDSGATHAETLRALTEELTKSGVLLKFERLASSAMGARAGGPKGKRTWTDGPFAESKELIAGFSILDVPSKADAIAWANRYADILSSNAVDVRRMAD